MLYYYDIYCKAELQFQVRKLGDHSLYLSKRQLKVEMKKVFNDLSKEETW